MSQKHILTPSTVTFKVSYEIINHPALHSAILLCISASKSRFLASVLKLGKHVFHLLLK